MNIRHQIDRLLEWKPAHMVYAWGRLLVESILDDQLFLRASALTYTTVLSIVPFLAVAFSVLKGFGFQNTDFIRDLLLRVSAGREQVVEHIITYINQTNVRTLGVVGVSFLVVTAVMLISNIENSLNALWGLNKGRSLLRKFTDYLSAIIIIPLATVAAISISATLQNNAVVQGLLEYTVIGALYIVVLKIIPWCIMWGVLLFIYMLLPQAKVRFTPAIVGAVVAGTVWQLAQWAYLTFQIGAAKYNAIYGSFAQLPLFLVWVYMSWVIVLLGAEVSFVLQNGKNLMGEAKFKNVSPGQRVQLSLKALVTVGYAFWEGKKPLSLEDLVEDLGAPLIPLRRIMEEMATQGILVRVDDEEREAWTMARSPETLRMKHVIDAFMYADSKNLPVRDGKAYALVDAQLAALDQLVTGSEHNLTLAQLLELGDGDAMEDASPSKNMVADQ